MPFRSKMRAAPEIRSSALQDSLVRSEWPSPLGETQPGEAPSVTPAARRSTVTTLLIDALLFEASAVQTVIRYGPSGTTLPAASFPFQVNTTFLPTTLPRRTAVLTIPSKNGLTSHPKLEVAGDGHADRGRVHPPVAVRRQERAS